MPGVGISAKKRKKNKEGTVSEKEQLELSQIDSGKLLGVEFLNSID